MAASSHSNIGIPAAAILLAGLPMAQARECARIAHNAALRCAIFVDIDAAVEAALSGDYAACVCAPTRPADFSQLEVLRRAGFRRPLIGLVDTQADTKSFDQNFDLIFPSDIELHTLIAQVSRRIAQSDFHSAAAVQAEFQLSPLFLEMRHSFLRGLADVIDEMQAALQNGEWANAQHQAHSLKGSAASFDCPPLAQLAKEIEGFLRAADTQAAEAQFVQLRVLATSLGR